jgi:hypothetical protein
LMIPVLLLLENTNVRLRRLATNVVLRFSKNDEYSNMAAIPEYFYTSFDHSLFSSPSEKSLKESFLE